MLIVSASSYLERSLVLKEDYELPAIDVNLYSKSSGSDECTIETTIPSERAPQITTKGSNFKEYALRAM